MHTSDMDMHTMPRVTLYVPEDLKARMDEIDQSVNWSAVAQSAFREAVTVDAIKRNPTDMEPVIERLRASKARVDRESLEAGRICGRTWAATTAEYDELRRLADWTRITTVTVPFTLNALKQLIDPAETMDLYRWHDFWQQSGNGHADDAFAEGFIKGAAELFEEIEDHL
jgi:hypothetical protein